MPLELNKAPVTKQPSLDLGSVRRLLEQGRKVSARDRMFFTEQLALLLETGNNLHASLQVLKGQMENPGMREVIGSLANDISEGHAFSHALARHPEVFPSTYVNLIAASETGGFMHQVLKELVAMDDKREKLHSTLVSALTYPVFLILFAFSVVIFVLVVVFPKFGDLFSMIEDQLPATTKILMAASNFMINHWLTIPVATAAFILTFGYWLKSPDGMKQMDRLKLSLPGLKEIFIQLYLVQSLRVMGLSLANGVGVIETLHACRDVVRNSLFRRFIDDVEIKVNEGAGIASGFSSSDFIPNLAEQMITTGEETGNLPKVMERLAEYYERELTRRINTFSRLVEPVMLLVMGAVVGLLVSSLILPIFKLSRAVH